MDKDKAQITDNNSLHRYMTTDNLSQQVPNITKDDLQEYEAEMDALELRLFAMAGSRR
jgi:hypothetical protein